ncbi:MULTISPECIES: Ig-like domain-containing protein [unclassified Leptospira]|uniref:Ig-like domain-containing protein n=1 Tax=unclassified Leptospira TaxID=2633828 RepID=UPI0002928A85|nr:MULTISPECIES: Ig-like domain-containing protein [unclassified Leptospira]EKO76443.1 Ig-like protein [Leptospira sp. Fiocruz LV3954]EMI61957.1 Ig-like protein [Leptospira sp. Fiocruz LV4135]
MGCVQGGKSSGIPFLAYLDFGNRTPSANSFNVFQISPGPNVTGVSLNTSIQVGFSQKLDPSTIQSQTIQLTQGNSVITGNLTSTEKTLLFNPTSALAASKVYTVRVSKDIKSEEGTSLSEDYVWNFTTGSVVDAIAPDLSLRTPAINATLVPNTTSVQVALTETMDCTSVNGGTLSLKNTTTGIYEAGPVACVGSVITFTPTFPLAFNTTYRVDLFSTAKDLANNTLANSYNWNFTTGPGPDAVPPTVSFISPAPNSLDIPINSGVSIAFSEPINCGTVNGNIVVLPVPAGGTVVTCTGTTVTLTPGANLASNTAYTVTFSNAITDLGGGNGLNPVPAPSTFTTAAAPVVDNTPPTVTSKVPAAGATGVGLNTNPMAVFSEPMNCASITTASFRLKETVSGTYLNGSVQCSGTSATWTPDPMTNPLAANTQYTVEVTAAAVDASASNNPLTPAVVAPNLWTFTTGPGLDTIRPNVVVVTPENGALGVSINGGANIAFSEAIDCGNIGGNIVLDDEPTFALPNIAININCNGNTASFTPAAALAFNTPYYAKIKSTVTDTATNSMNADYVWSFTTGVVADSMAPQISLSAPASGATGIPTNAAVTVAFNESINCATLNLTVNNGINGTTTCSGSSATFTPDDPPGLSASTTYTVTVAAGLKDIAGNVMATTSWNFTTGVAADNTPPTVTIQNLRDKSIVESGFVIGTAADARGIAKVEINIDNAGWIDVSGTTSWKFALPTNANTWRRNSSHTIDVRATDTSNHVTTSGAITVLKGTNKDINGDGYVDLVTSEYGQGLVYIFHSSGTTGITILNAAEASRTIVGVKADFFGKTVATGDFNGDGFADIAVGAPKSGGIGRVYIFHSTGTQGINTSFYMFANTILTGALTNEDFGRSLATGDISGDRYTDLVVGAPGVTGSSKGRVYVFHSQGGAGIASATVTIGAAAGTTAAATSNCTAGCNYFQEGTSNNDKFGFSIAVGNINGGIYEDIAVGAPGNNSGTALAGNGRVYVYYGNSGTGLTAPTLMGNSAATYAAGGYAQLGYSIAVADFNEDGNDDLVAGAPEFDPDTSFNPKGKVCIYTSGGALGIGNTASLSGGPRQVTGTNNGDHIGISIAARDLNLDGRADLMISTEPVSDNISVFITAAAPAAISGIPDLTARSYNLAGAGGYVGPVNGPGKLISTGDVNGDGIPDLIGTKNLNAPHGINIFHITATAQPANLAAPDFSISPSSLINGVGGNGANSNEFGAALY